MTWQVDYVSKFLHNRPINVSEIQFIEDLLTSERQSWIETARKEIEGKKKFENLLNQVDSRCNPECHFMTVDQILSLPSLSPLSKEE